MILDSISAKEACASGAVTISVYKLEAAWIDRQLAAGHSLTNGSDRRHDKIRRGRDEARLLEAAAERGRNLTLYLGKQPVPLPER